MLPSVLTPPVPACSCRTEDRGSKLKFSLGPGDVLIMAGSTQQQWQHAVPRRAGVKEPRVSLTFRTLLQPA